MRASADGSGLEIELVGAKVELAVGSTAAWHIATRWQ